MKVQINFKKLDSRAKMPAYGSEFSAGADLYAVTDGSISIAPGETKLIHTYISMEIPEGYGGFIFARSGLASKKGICLANGVGVVDSDYRGEIKVAVLNSSDEPYTIAPFERIAQLVFMPIIQADFVKSAELADTERGEGGFGSTGK